MTDLPSGELAENAERKDFTPSEMVAIAEAVRPLEEAAAKERKRRGKPSGKFPEATRGNGETRDKTAGYIGVSGRTLEKAAEVVAAATEDPEQHGDLIEEMARMLKMLVTMVSSQGAAGSGHSARVCGLGVWRRCIDH